MSANLTSIQDVAQLEELLSEPTEGVIRILGGLDGDIVVLGVGGKMGPTLARMAKKASEMARVKRRVIGVSRFSSSALRRPTAQIRYRNSALRFARSEFACRAS